MNHHNHIPQRNGHHYGTPPEMEEEDGDTLLTDEIDHQIVMHRDAHFGGDFGVMLQYYNNEDHIGIDPEFDIERIEYLSTLEKELSQDLAALLLTGSEAEEVGRARKAYAQFKEIYEMEETTPFPRLIADLILSEEEEPEEEIEAVVNAGAAIVPDLLLLLQSDDLYNPLFPGYGYAPFLAIICLGKIGDERAIVPLFEVLSRQFIFDETAILEAFASIGEPAKAFLLKILKSRPLTQDNPNAAYALLAFADDEEVRDICLSQLQDPSVKEKPLLRSYLEALIQ